MKRRKRARSHHSSTVQLERTLRRREIVAMNSLEEGVFLQQESHITGGHASEMIVGCHNNDRMRMERLGTHAGAIRELRHTRSWHGSSIVEQLIRHTAIACMCEMCAWTCTHRSIKHTRSKGYMLNRHRPILQQAACVKHAFGRRTV